jgi:hypothetical protein
MNLFWAMIIHLQHSGKEWLEEKCRSKFCGNNAMSSAHCKRTPHKLVENRITTGTISAEQKASKKAI